MHTSKILSIKKIQCDKTPVYDIHVPGNNNFIVENGLVVHNCKPYQYFRSCIYEKRIEMYYSARLFDEIISLEKNNNTGKVDHPPNGHKDVSDAVCGAVYNASKNAEQYAFDYGEDLEVTQAISNDINQFNQHQITIDFEAEMMKLLDPVQEEHKKDQNNNKNKQSSIPSNAMYLYDGIIVF